MAQYCCVITDRRAYGRTSSSVKVGCNEKKKYRHMLFCLKVLEVLDQDVYEKELYGEIFGLQDEMEMFMDATERLTKVSHPR